MSLPANDIWRYVSVPDERDLYVIGCLERPVTIYSQQVRALNVVRALVHLRKVGGGTSLAIVGGGIAGVTAAIGAAALGLQVTVLERAPHVMPVQRNSRRYVHPHLLAWPTTASPADRAGLPHFADWVAGPAGAIVANLDSRLALCEHVRVVTGVDGIESGTAGNSRWIRWTTSADSGTLSPCAVLVAVGFGGENAHEDYWSSDLETDSQEDVRDTLIAGQGDGALTDLFHVRLGATSKDRRPFLEWLVAELLPALRDVAPDVVEVETRAQDELPVPATEAPSLPQSRPNVLRPLLDEQLLQVKQDAARNAFTSRLEADYNHVLRQCSEATQLLSARLRVPGVRVTVAGKSLGPYSPDASALNRFLLAMLIANDRFTTFRSAEFVATPEPHLEPRGRSMWRDKHAAPDLHGLRVLHRFGARRFYDDVVGGWLRALATKQTQHLQGVREPIWTPTDEWK